MTRKFSLGPLIVGLLLGCVGGTQQSYSTSEIANPLEPSSYPVLIISQDGPQLDPKFYDILGKVNSAVENITAFERRCQGALNLLKIEARRKGADALIHVECGAAMGSARATGTAIRFKNRDQAMLALKEVEAILK